MLSLPCPLDRVLSVVLDHVAESGLKSLFDPPSLDPFLSMLLGCSIESGCWPPCPYRSKLISMLLGPGTETEVRHGHVPKAPNPYSLPLSNPEHGAWPFYRSWVKIWVCAPRSTHESCTGLWNRNWGKTLGMSPKPPLPPIHPLTWCLTVLQRVDWNMGVAPCPRSTHKPGTWLWYRNWGKTWAWDQSPLPPSAP